MGRRLRLAVLLFVVAAFVVVATGLFALFAPAPALASSSTITVLGGEVQIRRGEEAFRAAADGELLQSGDVVRTGPGAHAVLTYFDGSIVEIEPETELAIRLLGATTDGDILVLMEQTIGRTWHVVARALSANSRYEVRTPSGTAAVRGTGFEVSVLQTPAGEKITEVVTTEGKVALGKVEVPAGFVATATDPTKDPEPPRPAPPPPLSVTVVIGAAGAPASPAPGASPGPAQLQNALVVDPLGRAAGLKDGKPLLYVPGSKVSVVDGKVVVTMPIRSLGTVWAVVDQQTGKVEVETQVKSFEQVVASVKEEHEAQQGQAKSGVFIAPQGVLPLPPEALRQAPVPKIGELPPAPPPGGFIPFVLPPGASPFQFSLPPSPAFSPPPFSPPVFSAPPFTIPPGFSPPPGTVPQFGPTFGPPPGFTPPTNFPFAAPTAFPSPPPGFVPFGSPLPIFEFASPPPGFRPPPGFAPFVVPTFGAPTFPTFGPTPGTAPFATGSPGFFFSPPPGFSPAPGFTPGASPEGTFAPVTPTFTLPALPTFTAPPEFTASPTIGVFTPPPTFTPFSPPPGTFTPFPTTATFSPFPTSGTFTPFPTSGTFTPFPTTGTFSPAPTQSTFTPPPTATSTPAPPTATFTPPPSPP